MARSFPTAVLLTGLLALAPLAALAQTHKVAAPEKVTRAIGVYEWTGDLTKPTASRLIPVSLFIDGQLQDAAVYLARPVPLALESGNVYSIDEAGVSRGTFDLLTAGHLQSSNSDAYAAYGPIWLGFGKFIPPPIFKVAALKPSKTLPVINDDGRPHLVNRSPDASPSTPSRTTPSDRTPTDKTSTTTSSTDPDNDPDRPTLRKRSPAEQKEAQKAAQKQSSQPSVSGPSGSLNDDPDRPTLHRGRPAGSDTGEDLTKLTGVPADLHQLAAVSDPVNRPVHPFARPWDDENEHTAILAQLRSMAREQLAAYDKSQPPIPAALRVTLPSTGSSSSAQPTSLQTAPQSSTATEPAPPKLERRATPSATAVTKPTTDSPASTPVAPATASSNSAKTTPSKPLTPAQRRAAARKAAAAAAAAPPPPEPLLDEQVHAYTLSYGGAPTFVYTAHTGGNGAGLRYLAVVAQIDETASDDSNGRKLLLALHSVTDAAHLDRTPEFRLVDAVDAEASNRASLLFELRNQSTRQFALYRVLSGRSEQIFLSDTTQ